MKILPTVTAALALLGSVNMQAYAADEARVYGDVITENDGSGQYIQLYIENNPGIMGYKLLFEYPAESLEILDAHSGEITSGGMFLDNIGDSEGSFELLWNSTGNVSEDGTIAVLEVRQLNDEPYEIKVSFSQADTFNESWEDVVLVCENILSSEDSAGDDSTEVSDITAELEESLSDELSEEIYALETEQSPGEIIGDFLEERGEDTLTAENISELQSVFEAEGLDTVYGEKLSDDELIKVYGKAYEDYSGRVIAAKESESRLSGYRSAGWILYIAVPIAAVGAAGIIIILYRRMKNSEKQK